MCAEPQASRSHLFLPALLQVSRDVETEYLFSFVFISLQTSVSDLPGHWTFRVKPGRCPGSLSAAGQRVHAGSFSPV